MLEELREKECLGMSEVAWPQKRYVFTKKYKIHLSCPLLQFIQGEIERVTLRETDRGREKRLSFLLGLLMAISNLCLCPHTRTLVIVDQSPPIWPYVTLITSLKALTPYTVTL